MKVYGLKHATPGMKAQHMRMIMGWQANLQERQAQYRLKILRVVESRLMDELASLDPAWEVWFDDDDNVPDYGPIRERIQILERRVAELKQAPSAYHLDECPSRRDLKG